MGQNESEDKKKLCIDIDQQMILRIMVIIEMIGLLLLQVRETLKKIHFRLDLYVEYRKPETIKSTDDGRMDYG